MSRSRKRVAGGSTTCRGDRAGVEKSYKQAAHRANRRAVRMALRRGDESLPHDKEFGDPWCGPKDGKWQWFGPKDTKWNGYREEPDPKWYRK